MFVEVKCPTCGTIGNLSDAKVGRTVKCPQCGEVFKATVQATPPAPSAPAPSSQPAAAPPATRGDERADSQGRETPPAEPAYFRAAVVAAESIIQVVQFVVAVGVVGSIILLIAGVATGRPVEVVVVVVLAGVQLYLMSAGSKLVLSLVQVFVGVGRDVRTMRRRAGGQ